MRSRVLLAASTGLLLVAFPPSPKRPVVIWNASASVPTGFYHITLGAVRRGDLVLVQPPSDTLARRRGYLASTTYLIKVVAAVDGDRVCRFADRVLVRGVFTARAHVRDSLGRRMPVWYGCRRLGAGEHFLLAPHTDSFDSRYFGIVLASRIAGRVVPLWPIGTRS